MPEVAFSIYPDTGGEYHKYKDLPFCPRQDETVHLSITDDESNSRAWTVYRVSHAQDEHGMWRAEVALH